MSNPISFSQFFSDARKKGNLSQEAAAERCRKVTSQKMASRIESNPLEFPIEVVLDYVAGIGANQADFMKLLTTPKTLINRNNIMLDTELQKETDAFIKSLNSAMSKLDSLPEHIRPTSLVEKMEIAKNELSSQSTLPTLGIFGPSDSGKSHLINMLLGSTIAPEGFSPVTAANTIYMHSKKKPEGLNANEDVIVFKYMDGEDTFTLNMLHGDFERFALAKGSYEILEEYGARDEEDNIVYPEAYLAVVFVDTPILEKVNLLDTPGQLIDPDYSRKQGAVIDSVDVRKAYEAMGLADAILFTSSIIKFLRDNEPEFFSNILRAPGNVPLDPDNPLKHITILATHAFSVKSIEEFKTKTAPRASLAFHKSMGFLLYEDWNNQCEGIRKITKEDWADRMLPFWDDNEEFMTAFTEQFEQILQDVQDTLVQRRLNRLKVMKKQIAAHIDIELLSLDDKRRSNDERMEEVKAQDARFRQDVVSVLESFKKQRAAISNFEKETATQLDDVCKSLLNEDEMTQFIAERFEDKDTAKKGISDALGQHIETKCKNIINNASKRFAAEVEILVNEFSNKVPGNKVDVENGDLSGFEKSKLNVSAFDGHSAFIGGLSSATAFGAMGAYVATISSNLGAYILVGKAAGVLTSLGITGSVTTLPWLVSATGGPIVWGLMLAGLIGYAAFRLLSDWRKSLAKSVIKAIKKSDTLDSIESWNKGYWNDTRKAFDLAVEALREAADEHIKQMFKDAETQFSDDVLNEASDALSTAKAIFE
ncbi:hypothetical protein CFG65_09940 [Vibrio parahaemolyticus]|nr:hypothetical protein C9I78_00285 [Vibrio parahaemolyticus]AWJ77011.1 hypothetical protein C7Y67_00405 [Vibrio parahaemolyticus]PJR26683.1 hypothetical protein CFG65_09940 [Vibrio parahaemolyticus]HAS6930310.1 hypothetical protein [Vibrio parahaemolyticus]